MEEHSDKPRVVFTTEKDWMRLQAEELQKDVSLLPVFIVPIEVDFLTENEKVEFNHIIEDYVKELKIVQSLISKIKSYEKD